VQNHTICVQSQHTKLDMNKSNIFVLQYFFIGYKQASVYEEGASGTEAGRKDDSLTSYREKEPMTSAKIKKHEPTAIKGEMTEKITEPEQTATNPEEAKEKARRSDMAKGTDGAAEIGSEYEQCAAGTNK
jgi:hypothetical protein